MTLLSMKTYWGNGGIAPRILDLGTRWSEWSVSLLVLSNLKRDVTLQIQQINLEDKTVVEEEGSTSNIQAQNSVLIRT
jgi:hypothetical protein